MVIAIRKGIYSMHCSNDVLPDLTLKAQIGLAKFHNLGVL
jgi:hypothetical protein